MTFYSELLEKTKSSNMEDIEFVLDYLKKDDRDKDLLFVKKEFLIYSICINENLSKELFEKLKNNYFFYLKDNNKFNEMVFDEEIKIDANRIYPRFNALEYLNNYSYFRIKEDNISSSQIYVLYLYTLLKFSNEPYELKYAFNNLLNYVDMNFFYYQERFLYDKYLKIMAKHYSLKLCASYDFSSYKDEIYSFFKSWSSIDYLLDNLLEFAKKKDSFIDFSEVLYLIDKFLAKKEYDEYDESFKKISKFINLVLRYHIYNDSCTNLKAIETFFNGKYYEDYLLKRIKMSKNKKQKKEFISKLSNHIKGK